MKFIEHTLSGDADSLRISHRQEPSIESHEVLIRVAYAGVNRPDVLQRKGLYNPPADACPYLGLEVSGTIVAVGTDVTRWRVGDRVCALTHGGGYAELCVADATHCLPIPDGVSLSQAAALPETYVTVWANLFANNAFSAGQSILIHGGTSGIGITAIQLAKHFGGKVFTTVGDAQKAEFCRSLGADVVINYREEDFLQVVQEATGGKGVDVVLDMVGGKYVEKNLAAIALEGTLVQISFLEGSRMEIDLAPVMLKRLTFTGSTLRARSPQAKAALISSLEKTIWPILASAQCLPKIHKVYPLENASEAHRLMESSKHIGKIILQVEA